MDDSRDGRRGRKLSIRFKGGGIIYIHQHYFLLLFLCPGLVCLCVVSSVSLCVVCAKDLWYVSKSVWVWIWIRISHVRLIEEEARLHFKTVDHISSPLTKHSYFFVQAIVCGKPKIEVFVERHPSKLHPPLNAFSYLLLLLCNKQLQRRAVELLWFLVHNDKSWVFF